MNDQTPTDWKRKTETAERIDPVVGPEPIAAEPPPTPVDPAIKRRSRVRRIGFLILALVVLIGLILY
ncbi:MAG: EmrA/EmrK family multidrug efflux transporter periplasmic adaptor subunit, partial [Sphingomonas sp.]